MNTDNSMRLFTVIVETDDELIEFKTPATTLGIAIDRIGNTLEHSEFLFTGDCFVSCARIYKVSVKETKQ